MSPELGDEAGQVEAHELQARIAPPIHVDILHHVFVAAVRKDCETGLGAIQSLQQKTHAVSIAVSLRCGAARHDDELLRAECGT